MSSVSVPSNKVGVQSGNDGTYLYSRCDNTGAMVTADGHGRYFEPSRRGYVFSAHTAVTGVAPGTALGTTAAFCLHNPTGSGKWLVVQRLSMGYISGTLGAGTVSICSSTSGDAVPTGTAIVPRNLLVGSSNSPVALPFTTATITTNAAKMIGVLCANTALLASTAVAPWLLEKEVAGEIVIAPGFNITLHGTTAAGSTPLVVFAATWEEVTQPS
jgi:hypothetical protein